VVKLIDNWEIAEIGSVSVVSSDRARYTRITLKHDGSITLTVPRRVSLRQAREFLESRIPWIRRHQSGFRAPDSVVGPVVSRAEARRLLTERVRELARAHGFVYNKVFVKNQRTLWGSCSTKNNINLNINLLRLPEDLRDYVILHELLHIRHRNHSKAFWADMDRLVGDGKKLQKRLRKYKLGV
jgi:predicted metal-dependent hydrolase